MKIIQIKSCNDNITMLLWSYQDNINEEEIEMYEVIDRKTGLRIGIYKTSKAAIRAVNRLDNIYGACRYYKKTIE